VKGKKVVIVGDILHSRVALSSFCIAKLQGAEAKGLRSKTLLPKYTDKLGVKVENEFKQLELVHVANMFHVQNERMEIKHSSINKRIHNNLS
jgi:aspartate carbamoyltransferase catalytic subunit